MFPNSAHNIGDDLQLTCPIAYVLLWFPLASETFIFREVAALRKMGLPIHVYTMYGKALKGCSKEMLAHNGPIFRMGVTSLFQILGAFIRALWQNPAMVCNLLGKGLFRKMRNLEAQCENIWCFFAGFLLAEKCKQSNIALIHASWANGPATAAWIASSLSGIPFAFTGRAGDIYPQDGILPEKIAGAKFVRTNNSANVTWLSSFCAPTDTGKIFLIYNNLPSGGCTLKSIARPRPPYKILAVGRFARTKGFPDLFTAMARLKRENFPVELELVGDGSWRHKLESLRKTLGLEDCVHMPGFLPNDQVRSLMGNHNLLVVPSVVHSNGDRDGIPNVIMEAFRAGMPVVATDVCGISEVIRNGETGLLVPQRNPAALALAIRQMLEDWPNAMRMAENGATLVKEMFDEEKNSSALRDLYLGSLKGQCNA